MDVLISLSGVNKINEAFRRFGQKTAVEAMGFGLKAAARDLYMAERASVPAKSGQAQAALKINEPHETEGKLSVSVGSTAKDYTGKYFYLSFLEYGWQAGKRRRGLKNAYATLRKFTPGRINMLAFKTGEQRKRALKRITSAKLSVARDTRKQIAPKQFIKKAFDNSVERVAATLEAKIIEKIETLLNNSTYK